MLYIYRQRVGQIIDCKKYARIIHSFYYKKAPDIFVKNCAARCTRGLLRQLLDLRLLMISY